MAKTQEDPWADLPGFDPVKREFVTLDLDRWLKEHRIADLAKADGKQNLPPVGSAWGKGGIPDKIVAWVNRRARQCRGEVNRWLNDFQIDLGDLRGLEHEKQRIQQTLENARLDLESVANGQRNELIEAQQTVRDARQDYDRFRGKSELLRPPDYADRRSSLLYISLFFVLEIVLNATSLMDANPFGLIGAVGQMGLICLVNILFMGSWMGGLLRLLHHVRPLVKCISAFLALLVLLFVVGFNLIVGHFRDSMQAIIHDPVADFVTVGRDTFSRFSENFIAFDSFQSALLALLGFLFFCFASWKWFDRDDHYPGYGKKHRLLEEKQADYRRLFRVANDRLREVFKDYQERLKDVLHSLNAQQTRLIQHRTQGESVISGFGINMEQYQHDLKALLGAYIAANRSTRTEPEPAWFSDKFSIDRDILVPPAFDVPETANLASVENLEHEAITTLQGFYDKNMAKFPTLEQAMGCNTASPEQARSH